MSLLRRDRNGRGLSRFLPSNITSSGNPWFIPTNGQIGSLMGGQILVTPESSMQVSAVWACVRLLSGVVAGLPMYAIDADGKKLPQQPAVITDPFGGEDNTDPLLLSRREGIRQIMVSLLLRGNAYVNHVTVGRDGRPTMLQVLNPDAVSAKWDDKVVIQVNGHEVDPDTVSICRGLSQPGSLLGMSPITYARRTIGLAMAAEEFGAAFFTRGATMSGVVESPADLNAQQAAELRAAFESNHAALKNAHAVGVLPGGATFRSITIMPEDAQFLGTQAAKTLDIAMLYGVPPHMIGQVDRTTSWGKGIEEQTTSFRMFTLKFWTDIIEDFWSNFLPHGTRARFDFDDLNRPDTTSRYASYQAARNASFMSINEIRLRENLDPVDGGDDLYAPLNSAHS